MVSENRQYDSPKSNDFVQYVLRGRRGTPGRLSKQPTTSLGRFVSELLWYITGLLDYWMVRPPWWPLALLPQYHPIIFHSNKALLLSHPSHFGLPWKALVSYIVSKRCRGHWTRLSIAIFHTATLLIVTKTQESPSQHNATCPCRDPDR